MYRKYEHNHLLSTNLGFMYFPLLIKCTVIVYNMLYNCMKYINRSRLNSPIDPKPSMIAVTVAMALLEPLRDSC